MMDAELRKLWDGLLDADEASDKVGYLKRLERDNPRQYDKLMHHLCEEVEKELRKDLQ